MTYASLDLVNSVRNAAGLQVVYGNMVKQHDGMEWQDIAPPTEEQLQDPDITIVYGWIKPGDWVRIIRGKYDHLLKPVKVLEVFRDKIKVGTDLVNWYVQYYEVEISNPKLKRNVLKATKMDDKKTGGSFYKIKE